MAVCDTNRAPAKAKAKAWGVPRFITIMLSCSTTRKLTWLSCWYPHFLPCPMTVQAAAAGKHISVQKPMALSAAEADEMIAATEKAGVVLRVYENFVHYEPARKAKAYYWMRGEIGNPIMLRMHITPALHRRVGKSLGRLGLAVQ